MVFFGTKVIAGSGPQTLQLKDGDVLNITSLALVDEKEEGASAQVYIKVNSKAEFLVAVLTPEKPVVTGLALQMDEEDKAQLVVKGSGVVHAVGYIDYDDDDVSSSGTDESDDFDVRRTVGQVDRGRTLTRQ